MVQGIEAFVVLSRTVWEIWAMWQMLRAYFAIGMLIKKAPYQIPGMLCMLKGNWEVGAATDESGQGQEHSRNSANDAHKQLFAAVIWFFCNGLFFLLLGR